MNQKTHIEKESENTLVISFKGLRKSIGFAGIAMPFFMAFGVIIFSDCTEIQRSISAYYHTVMRDVFLAIISAFSFFLYSYRGYDRMDNILTKAASVCAIGLALSPTTYRVVESCTCEPGFGFAFSQIFHLIFAISFFLILTYISLFQFTKTHEDKPMTKRKKVRNMVYRICGYVMLGCVVGVALYWLCESKGWGNFEQYKPIFYFESLALIAFGFSWLVKGEVILQDKK